MSHNDIRIGTLVDGLGPDPAAYISQILPHGFESFEITFWRTLGGVDLAGLAGRVREAIGDADVTIGTVGIYGNPLEDDPEDEATRRAWEHLIDHAHLFGADVVAGFTGRLRGRPIDASLPRFKEVFEPLAKRAADRGLRLAFENCATRCSLWASCPDGNQPVKSEACDGSDHVDGAVASRKSAPSPARASKVGVVVRS
jgi:sugar phosphate isomerase/epimerase